MAFQIPFNLQINGQWLVPSRVSQANHEELIRATADALRKMLQVGGNHPCLAAWCGNNASELIWLRKWTPTGSSTPSGVDTY
jgi:hypothetical protein